MNQIQSHEEVDESNAPLLVGGSPGSELAVLFAAPATDDTLRLEEPNVPTVSSVGVTLPMHVLRGCSSLRDLAKRTAPLVPLARFDPAVQLLSHAAVSSGDLPAKLQLQSIAKSIAVDVEAEGNAPRCRTRVTFFVPAIALLKARIAYVGDLYNQLATIAQSKGVRLSCNRLSSVMRPPVGATSVRAALGQCTYRPPLDGLLVGRVQAAIEAELANGCMGLLETPRAQRKQRKTLYPEERQLLASLAPTWRTASATARRDLEAYALQHLKARAATGSTTGWTARGVRDALKNRAALRRPRPLMEIS